MKHAIPILTLLLSFIGSAVQAQTGMTVFGNCSVAEHTVIVVSDEQLTLEGDVTGEGSLIMAGADTQTIASHNHAIDRLVVANPKAVKVKGKLTIRKSLTVERGNLVVEPHAELVIEPGALVTLMASCKRIQSGVIIQPGKQPIPTGNQSVKMGDGLVIRAVFPDGFGAVKTGFGSLQNRSKPYENPDLQNRTLPPWRKQSEPVM